MTSPVINLFGFKIELHWSLIFIIFIAFATNNLMFWGAFILFTLFHEIGHIVAARLCGLRTDKITLFCLGGFALAETPSCPKKYFIFVLGGPLINVLLIPLTLILPPEFMIANLLLLINFLPIYSLDGGHLLRIVLTYFFGKVKGDMWTAYTGRVLIFLCMSFLLYIGNISLIILGLFYAWIHWLDCDKLLSQAFLMNDIHDVKSALRNFSRRVYK